MNRSIPGALTARSAFRVGFGVLLLAAVIASPLPSLLQGCSPEAPPGTHLSAAPNVNPTQITPKEKAGVPPPLEPPPSPRQIAAELAPSLLQSHGAAAGLRPHSMQALRWLVRSNRLEMAASALAYSLDQFTGDELDTARYLLGRTLTQLDDPTGLEVLQALPDPFSPIDDLRLNWLARAYVLAGQPAAAIETVDLLQKGEPKSELLYELRVIQSRLLGDAGERKRALDVLGPNDRAGSAVPRWLRAETLRTKADLLRESSPKDSAALEKYLLLTHPAEEATVRKGMTTTVEDLSDKERFQRAERLAKDWNYVEARDEFRRLMDHKTLGYEAMWEVAEISQRTYRDNPVEAREIYQKLAKRSGPHRGKAAFRVTQTYLRENDYGNALKEAKKLGGKEDGAFYRGWIPYIARDCDDAMPHLKEYGERKGDSEMKGFYAWCFIREKRWEEAVPAFEKLVKYGNPIVRGKAWYWQAYALEKQGKVAAAKEKLASLHTSYPLTYYDILAYQMEARWDGKDPTASKLPIFEGAGKAAHLEVGDEAWEWPTLSAAQAKKLAAVRHLVELDELERARGLYAEVRSAAESAVARAHRDEFIAFMGEQVQNYYHGWQQASGSVRAMSDQFPDAEDARWQLAYPRAYRPMVEALAAEYGITPYLIYGIMLQESRFRWYQVSSWDAMGALQMIPKTAVKVGAEIGKTYRRHTFMEPRVGFEFSAFYMAKHHEMWNQNLTLTAASYNGGPHKVEAWMKASDGAPLDFLVEDFTFDQSRHYCRKVAEHMLRYITLYEDDPEVRAELIDELFPLEVNYDIPEDTGY